MKTFDDGALKAGADLCGKKKSEVERRSEEMEETCGGGMRRSRVPWKKEGGI